MITPRQRRERHLSGTSAPPRPLPLGGSLLTYFQKGLRLLPPRPLFPSGNTYPLGSIRAR
ncbi:hypothetical protein E2C01_068072 [Portunus trituberculatus]|uniref:Uncharacterized protein n=1 Tax=Portunus trituberculatus TaxID=210409 RepID=A0A5B7HVJ9_PORTR|nr:hypothetical protein [Portunus trituberculatus]